VLKPPPVDEVAAAPVSGGVGSPVTTTRGSRTRDIFREHVPIVALVLLYCLAGYVAEAAAGLPQRMDNVWFQTTYQVYPTLALLALPFAFAAYRWTLRDSEGRWIPGLMGWRVALSSSRSGFFTAPRLVGIAVTAVIMPLFLNTYGSWKGMIPDLHRFALDQAFSDLDRIIHLGRFPWELLQPLLGHPAVTRTIDVLYILWLPLNAAVLIWQGWSRGSDRSRFFLSYVLIYIVLGTAGAIALSTAGPCYYQHVTGDPSPYAPLMTYLAALDAEQPLIALRVQRTLWENYASGGNMPFVGISAMPSVHVAVAVLFVLLGRRTSPWLGLVFAAYATVVLVGSVHLGWHYAVDGYVSIVGTLAIWRAVGALLSRNARVSDA
jgi:PAP2 superfamily